jgi:hypothetical protein
MFPKPRLKIISFYVHLYLLLFTILKWAKSLISCINGYQNQISVNYIRNTDLPDDIDIYWMVTTSMSNSILLTHTHIYSLTHSLTHLLSQTHTHAFINILTLTHSHTHTHTHTHTHAHKHTHEHTYMYISVWYMNSKTTEIFTSICLLKYKSR